MRLSRVAILSQRKTEEVFSPVVLNAGYVDDIRRSVFSGFTGTTDEIKRTITSSPVTPSREMISAGLTRCEDRSVKGKGTSMIVPLLYISFF